MIRAKDEKYARATTGNVTRVGRHANRMNLRLSVALMGNKRLSNLSIVKRMGKTNTARTAVTGNAYSSELVGWTSVDQQLPVLCNLCKRASNCFISKRLG